MHDATESPAPRLLAVGQLFLDVVFPGLDGAPRLGEEHWTSQFGWGPGGIANYAVAAARLGVPTTVCAEIGTDPFSGLVADRLAADGVALAARRRTDWTLPVTASLGFDGDRALVTGGVAASAVADLFAEAPAADLVALHVDASVSDEVRRRAAAGARIFADVGWDADGHWDPAVLDALEGCHAFLPNEGEALRYTGADDALAAARLLAERVPVAVVTRGSDGAVAVDARTGEEVVVPPVRVAFVDATGAGDVFGAAFAAADLTDWSLRRRVDFAALVAAVTVSRPGGAAAAPRLDELVPWLDAHPAAVEPDRFDHLRDALPDLAFPHHPTRK